MQFGRRYARPSVSRLHSPRPQLEILEERLPPGDLGFSGMSLLDPPLLALDPPEPVPSARARRDLSHLSTYDAQHGAGAFDGLSLAGLAGSHGAALLYSSSSTAPMPGTGSDSGVAGGGEFLLESVNALENGDDGGIATVGWNVLTNSRANCGGGRGVIQSETAIAISDNAVVVGYNDFRGFYCTSGYQVTGWAYSLDYGQTFTDGGPLPGGTSLRGDPWLVTGPGGSIFMASLWNGLASLAVLRGTVTETGISWANPVVISAGGQFDKEALAVDPNSGALYLTYTRFGGPGGIWLYRSLDGGYSFDGPYAVRQGTSPQLQGSFPTVGPNGEVYVAYNIGYPGSSGVGFAVSYDQGRTFTDRGQVGQIGNFTVPGSDRAPAFPQIAVDTSGWDYHGTIYMTWQTQHLRGNGDVVMIRSTDDGATWSSPQILNDDSTTALQWFPTVSVDLYGFVNVFFYDRRENPGTAITNLYFTQSYDGGASFSPNVRVTDTPSTWRTSSDGTPANGDYINSTSGYDPDSGYTYSVVAFADSRDGDPDTYFASVLHDGA